jgi:3',5'-cyclic AMP phosphodiesterase CpdA
MPGIDELSEIWTWLEIIKETQFQWLENELRTAPTDKALILSVHHSPFSADEEHSGSDTILKVLDKAFRQDTVCPTLFSQDMFTLHMGGKKHKIPYLVISTAGHWKLHAMQKHNNGSRISVPFNLHNMVLYYVLLY